MTDSTGRRLKVLRVIDDYELVNAEEELARRWSRKENRSSLRELATWLNKRLLETVVREKGETRLTGEIDALYESLVDSNVSRGERTQTHRTLEQMGIDVDSLTDDFVSYQAVRTYLNERGIEHEPSTTGVSKVLEQIQKLTSRTTAVTNEKLTRLRDSDQISLGKFRLTAEVSVYCEDCESQYSVGELLQNSGCECVQGSD